MYIKYTYVATAINGYHPEAVKKCEANHKQHLNDYKLTKCLISSEVKKLNFLLLFIQHK